jgi:nitrate reductase cytochrome c-type subunit
MLPIMLGDNECVECHHPDNVESEEDMPFPKTHFERPVMGESQGTDGLVWVVERYEEGDDLVGARYNCTMCHTTQATNVRNP